MVQMPIKEGNGSSFNKKAISIIGVLLICGVITGLALSSIFITEALERIQRFDDDPDWRPHFPPPTNASFNNFTLDYLELSPADFILPTIGVVIVCISFYFLAGLIIVYFRIFYKTKSKYIAGLLFFLTPLFIQSVFSVTALRSLFVSSAIPFPHIRESIGFGFGGLGAILVIVSLFEIIGLSILLYLSTE